MSKNEILLPSLDCLRISWGSFHQSSLHLKYLMRHLRTPLSLQSPITALSGDLFLLKRLGVTRWSPWERESYQSDFLSCFGDQRFLLEDLNLAIKTCQDLEGAAKGVENEECEQRGVELHEECCQLWMKGRMSCRLVDGNTLDQKQIMLSDKVIELEKLQHEEELFVQVPENLLQFHSCQSRQALGMICNILNMDQLMQELPPLPCPDFLLEVPDKFEADQDIFRPACTPPKQSMWLNTASSGWILRCFKVNSSTELTLDLIRSDDAYIGFLLEDIINCSVEVSETWKLQQEHFLLKKPTQDNNSVLFDKEVTALEENQLRKSKIKENLLVDESGVKVPLCQGPVAQTIPIKEHEIGLKDAEALSSLIWAGDVSDECSDAGTSSSLDNNSYLSCDDLEIVSSPLTDSLNVSCFGSGVLYNLYDERTSHVRGNYFQGMVSAQDTVCSEHSDSLSLFESWKNKYFTTSCFKGGTFLRPLAELRENSTREATLDKITNHSSDTFHSFFHQYVVNNLCYVPLTTFEGRPSSTLAQADIHSQDDIIDNFIVGNSGSWPVHTSGFISPRVKNPSFIEERFLSSDVSLSESGTLLTDKTNELSVEGKTGKFSSDKLQTIPNAPYKVLQENNFGGLHGEKISLVQTSNHTPSGATKINSLDSCISGVNNDSRKRPLRRMMATKKTIALKSFNLS